MVSYEIITVESQFQLSYATNYRVVQPHISPFFLQDLPNNYPSRRGFITGRLSPPPIVAASQGRYSDGMTASPPCGKTYLPLPQRRPLPCEEKQCKTFLVIQRQKVITSLANGKPSQEFEQEDRIMTSLQ